MDRGRRKGANQVGRQPKSSQTYSAMNAVKLCPVNDHDNNRLDPHYKR